MGEWGAVLQQIKEEDMRLTRHEQETIINFNEGEKVAYIHTRMKEWWERLEKNGFKPTKVSGDAGGIYAKEFIVPKECILFPVMLSPAVQKYRMALREKFKESNPGIEFKVGHLYRKHETPVSTGELIGTKTEPGEHRQGSQDLGVIKE